MLPKKNRADKKDLEEVFKKGLFAASPLLTFRYVKIKNSQNFKISFIAPKTVNKSAVKRNFLRRRGYIALEKNLGGLPFPVIGAFIFRKNNIENLENEIKNIFNKIH